MSTPLPPSLLMAFDGKYFNPRFVARVATIVGQAGPPGPRVKIEFSDKHDMVVCGTVRKVVDAIHAHLEGES